MSIVEPRSEVFVAAATDHRFKGFGDDLLVNAVSHAAEMEGFIAEVRGTSGWRSLVVPIGNGEFVALKPVR